MFRHRVFLSRVFSAFFLSLVILSQYGQGFASNEEVEYRLKSILDEKAQYGLQQTTNNLHEKEILIKYKKEGKSEQVRSAVNKKFSNSNFKVKKKLKLSKAEVITVDVNSDINSVIQELKKSPDVEYAQPNYKLYSYYTPSDEYYNLQWGIHNSGQYINDKSGTPGIDINVVPVWDYTRGNEFLTVGVLDSGIDVNHVDLKNNIFVNLLEIPGNGIDDDSNGYIDDISGWDFAEINNSVYDSSVDDRHGTHVAGIIGAESNLTGVSGVAPEVKILPMKFFAGVWGGYTSDAIEAIEYAKKMNVKIINCSWGSEYYNEALKQAIAGAPDILFVCAAGNGGEQGTNLDLEPVYPACYDLPNLISVASVNNIGNISKFSNYGSKINVAAPGEAIYSTVPENQYSFMSGTSMAAPFVTGIAALLKSYNSEITPAEIVANISNNVKKLGSLSGKVSKGGMVNAYGSFIEVSPLPTATPTIGATATPTVGATATPTTSGNISILDIGEGAGHAGDNVIIPVNFSGIPLNGATNCGLTLKYDSSALEVISVSAGDIVTDAESFSANYSTSGTIELVLSDNFMETGAVAVNGTLANICFKIKTGAEAGHYNIEFDTEASFFGEDMIDTDITFDIGKVTVLGANTPVSFPTDSVATPTITPTATSDTTLTPTPTKTNIKINIPDRYLKSAIMNELGKSSGDIYLHEVETITELNAGRDKDASPGGITNIEGIQYLKNLKFLDLSYNRITNISCLSSLENLNQLILDGNLIGDISPLAGLVKLRGLFLSQNQIYSIGTLAYLKNLINLDLSNNYIADISPLSGLTKMEQLLLSNNRISNVNALSNLKLLCTLNLRANKITDINPLSGLTDLYNLNLSENELYSINALYNMVRLTELELSDTKLSNISILSRFTNLSILSLSKNNISSIEALRGLGKLTYLELFSNRIQDINPLSGLTKIIYLDLGGNNISNISGLYYMSNLTFLGLDLNYITNIDILSRLNKLAVLSLTFNRISNIEPLRNLTNLKVLYLKGNPITDFSPVAGYYYALYDKDFNLSYVPVVPPVINPWPVVTGPVTPVPTSTSTPTPTYKPTAATSTSTPTSKVTSTPTATPTPTASLTELEKNIPEVVEYTDIKGHWAENSINVLLQRNIITGYPDGTIKPNSQITRAEIAVLLCKAVYHSPEEKTVLKFKDSNSIPSWAKGYVQTAVDKGIIKGYDDNTFKASNKLTRVEIVVMALRAFGISEAIGTPVLNFKDAKKIPNWAKRYVSRAMEIGVVKGYNDYTFRPDKNVTRAEAFSIIAKCIEINNDNS